MFYIYMYYNGQFFFLQRYYGDSLPYGPNKTFEPTTNMRYLSVEQALADYAVLVQEIKTFYQIKKAIVLGGR